MGILSVFVILFLAIYTVNKVSKISNGDGIKSILEFMGGKEDNIFNMISYEADYTMVVVSNKNTNSYNIKEIYSDGKTKYEYLDSTNSKVVITINKDKVKVQNENQKNVLIQDFKNVGLNNSISISTFLELYKNKKGVNANNKAQGDELAYMEGLEINEYLKNGYLRIIMKAKHHEINGMTDSESFKNMFKDISSIELEIEKKTKLPSTYVVYNKNKKQVVSIIYNKFNINPKIDNKVFDI